ncbi:hypothetical protein C7B65_22750 [Phormidesmis priestleyi ULC007]|uniref:Uncharacterized protein n=1 Tax=Phormidesmis priestleyi ULC007 TaxID=1920490 RepID=A0A2T1D6I2_9CYAN|nr:hypothetical protein [Phormidesmis priestleyi]PSB16047.1 hypothetical protein C7B65_22750 [Phormidesmis priestleyi ULC007]PZO52243.1 MAG: hypothetical protein DCF14_07200 [Phormidesmis priestleyi]
MPLQSAIFTPREIAWCFVIVISSIYSLFLLINAAYDEAARNPTPRRYKRRKIRKGEFNELDNLGVPMEILALTHNRETAYRLYNDVRWRYSAQSAQWIWDKVKWDIIRDRH